MLHRTIETTRRRNLPHWQSEEGTYFATFRLFDSLPQDLARLRGGKHVEEALDRGLGSAYLARPEIAEVVFNALRFFDQQRYVLHTASVMPNHVHAVFRTAPAIRVADVLHSWKSFTAFRANRLLGRAGPFWQRESFDRLIRDRNEFDARTHTCCAILRKQDCRVGSGWVSSTRRFQRDTKKEIVSGAPFPPPGQAYWHRTFVPVHASPARGQAGCPHYTGKRAVRGAIAWALRGARFPRPGAGRMPTLHGLRQPTLHGHTTHAHPQKTACDKIRGHGNYAADRRLAWDHSR